MSTNDEPRDGLARRIRGLLAPRDVREVRMFGGLSFMVDERLAVSAGRGGDLLVHVDPAEYESLLARRRASGHGRRPPDGPRLGERSA